MKFFDSNILVGRKTIKDYSTIDSEAQLFDIMDSHGIEKALIIHADQKDAHPEDGNRNSLLFTKSHRAEHLFAILPPATEEFEYDVFEYMKKNRIKGMTAFPKYQNFLLNRISMGPFMDEVCERKIPLFLSLWGDVTWDDIYKFMSDYPEATVVIKDLYDWDQDRYYYPLLTAFKNLYMETNKMHLVADGIKDAVKKFGSERFVFGTAYPRCYIYAAKMDLLHADISQKDKENIAYNNLERLLNNAIL